VAVACQDEAGPFQTVPYPGAHWAPAGHPARQAQEYLRLGTAKLLTLFRPATGTVRATGVTQCPNAVLHPWLKAAMAALLLDLPAPGPVTDPEANRACWTRWQAGLRVRITLPDELPRLRLLLVWDNLAGHHTPELVLWLFAQGVMVLSTPLSGSWLNIITGRDNALSGIQMQRVDQVSNDVYGEKSLNRYLNPAAFAQPAAGTLGNYERNSIRGPAYWTVDVAVSRQVSIGAARTLELRVESFNLFNTFNWGNPVTNFNSGTFGRITSMTGTPRIMQFGVKYGF